ncbi:hypothetical protein LR48_Vigan843s001400 [Vigna angularis]|uniref:Uncharacterized protein n=1 Tax=Phaseolus angularis TaxID=3914 RepID=A0A0L9THR3_PHAAN|nr:hypothetical protein LR48_Vigan843s001400 [Vigna angularis]
MIKTKHIVGCLNEKVGLQNKIGAPPVCRNGMGCEWEMGVRFVFAGPIPLPLFCLHGVGLNPNENGVARVARKEGRFSPLNESTKRYSSLPPTTVTQPPHEPATASRGSRRRQPNITSTETSHCATETSHCATAANPKYHRIQFSVVGEWVTIVAEGVGGKDEETILEVVCRWGRWKGKSRVLKVIEERRRCQAQAVSRWRRITVGKTNVRGDGEMENCP